MLRRLTRAAVPILTLFVCAAAGAAGLASLWLDVPIRRAAEERLRRCQHCHGHAVLGTAPGPVQAARGGTLPNLPRPVLRPGARHLRFRDGAVTFSGTAIAHLHLPESGLTSSASCKMAVRSSPRSNQAPARRFTMSSSWASTSSNNSYSSTIPPSANCSARIGRNSRVNGKQPAIGPCLPFRRQRPVEASTALDHDGLSTLQHSRSAWPVYFTAASLRAEPPAAHGRRALAGHRSSAGTVDLALGQPGLLPWNCAGAPRPLF